MLRGLFEGTQYNSEAGAKCAVYSRARTKQGHGVIKEIRYIFVWGYCWEYFVIFVDLEVWDYY